MNFTKLNPNADGAERRRTDQRVGEVGREGERRTVGSNHGSVPRPCFNFPVPVLADKAEPTKDENGGEARESRAENAHVSPVETTQIQGLADSRGWENFWDIAPDEAHAFWVNDIYSDNYETERE